MVSGDRCLAFFWEGDQLYARPGPVDRKKMGGSEWTSIFLRLREPLTIANLDEFANFLCKSLLFTESTETVRVLLDNGVLFKCSKKRSAPAPIPVAPSRLLLSCSSKPSGLFTLQGIQSQAVQLNLDKRYVSEASSRRSTTSLLSGLWNMAKQLAKSKQLRLDEERMRAPGLFSLFLHIIIGDVKVTTKQSFVTAMERITKKSPPTRLQVLLLYSSYDEVLASSQTGTSTDCPHPALNGVLPAGRGTGRIFIGFETHQTTGLAAHVAAPFIPTVERESLDFVDRNLALWNEELLRVSGKMVRLVYEVEAQTLQKLHPQGSPLSTGSTYWDRARHLYDAFGVQESTPNALVAYSIEDELFMSTRAAQLCIASTVGVVSAQQVRTIPVSLESFVKKLPRMIDSSSPFTLAFCRHLQVPPASFGEIVTSINGEILGDDEVRACMTWIIAYARLHGISARDFNNMLLSIIVRVGGVGSSERAPLAQVTHYPCPELLQDPGIPLPSTCLSPTLFDSSSAHEVATTFNMKELNVTGWTKFVVESNYVADDADRAERILSFLAKCFSGLSDTEKGSVASILSPFPIIPTLNGLKKPGEVVLEDVKLFGGQDSDTINIRNRRVISDAFLMALGVRSHVDVSQIFAGIEAMKWDHRKLIKYLVRFRSQLSADELNKLREAAIFPAIGLGEKSYKLSDLFMDNPMVKFLGLPVIDWKEGKPPSPTSESTIFMVSLGLNTVPPCDLLLRKVGSVEVSDRGKILRYFIDHYQSDYRGFFEPRNVDFDYLPLIGTDSLGRPANSYLDEGLLYLGFPVLVPELRPYASIFGVHERPPSKAITKQLISRHFALQNVPKLFSYLSSIAGYFNSSDYMQLSTSAFIPLGEGTHHRPVDLFFSKGQFDLGDNVFTTIDLGHEARPFLRACGVQEEPRANHLVYRLANDASSILFRMGGESYLSLLRWIAVQLELHPDRQALDTLAKYPVLLGVDYELGSSSNESEKAKEDELLTGQYVLARAEDLFIMDDTVAQQIFKCLSVPLDTTLETFYRQLGSRPLSRCVKSQWNVVGQTLSTENSARLQQLISTRAPLLVSTPSASQAHAQSLSRLTNLQVAIVGGITINRSFRGSAHSQPTTACLKSQQLLLVTDPFDFFDVASLLSGLIYVESRLTDSLLIANLLSSSLASLRSKGFPVDRLLQSKRPPELSARNVEDPKIESPKQDKAEPKKKDGLFESIRNVIKSAAGVSTQGAIEPPGPNSGSTRPPSSVDEAALRATLLKGISRLRSSRQSIINVAEQVKPPSSIVSESQSYCQVVPDQSLQRLESSGDIAIYNSSHNDANHYDPASLGIFIDLLSMLAQIFSIPTSTISVFMDPVSTSIAFNRNNSLFFNYCHYERQMDGSVEPVSICASWYMTMCHELAHNFIQYLTHVTLLIHPPL